MTSASASLGPWRWTVRPSHRISPPSGPQSPETVLIREDFPAPLSPMRAVTLPAGICRSTSVRARTGPNVLVTLRSSSSVPLPPAVTAPFFSSLGRGSEVLIVWPSWATRPPAEADGRAAPFSVAIDQLRSAYPGLLAGVGILAGAQLSSWDEVVLDDRVVHVLGGDPLRLEQHGGDGLVLVDVLGRAVEQRGRRGLAGTQVQR